MVTQCGDHLFLLVNAARKEIDYRYIGSSLGDNIQLTPLKARGLIELVRWQRDRLYRLHQTVIAAEERTHGKDRR